MSREASSRQWATLRLTGGFNLIDVVHSAISLADSRPAEEAIRNIHEMMNAGCDDEAKWDSMIGRVAELCRTHPDALQESGTWYNGGPGMLALALTLETSRVVSFNLRRGDEAEEVSYRVYRVFRYLLRAMAQVPAFSSSCLTWVDNVTNYCPPLAPED